MSTLPTTSLRCAPEHQPLIRDVARALRTRPDLANALAALLTGGPAPMAPSSFLTDLTTRLEAVESWIAERNTNAMRCDIAVGPSLELPPPPADAADHDGPSAPTEQQAQVDAYRAALVKAARMRRDWTQRELACKAGVSLPTVSRLERRMGAGGRAWRKIAGVLGIADSSD